MKPYNSLLCKSRWTIIGINLGMCDDNLPEVYTSFRNAEVNRFVRSIAEPDYEYNICNKDPDEHSAIQAVSEALFTYEEYPRGAASGLRTCFFFV